MQDDHMKPPETIKEVGIHIGYMSRHITELKNLIEDQNKSYATKTELLDFERRNDDRIVNVKAEIKSLQEWNIWAQRIVLGAVLIAVMGLVIKGVIL